jgi:hypothetical protein
MNKVVLDPNFVCSLFHDSFFANRSAVFALLKSSIGLKGVQVSDNRSQIAATQLGKKNYKGLSSNNATL